MDHKFWDDRWSAGQTPFHQEQVDPGLINHWADLHLGSHARVLVPLCGKTLDMLWLAEQGHQVVGVEFSAQAVDAFFEENDLARDTENRGDMTVSRSGPIEIWCGDFFQVPATVIQACTGVYDRGSLVALPPDLRARYTARMCKDLPAAARVLLQTVEYDQAVMGGPPFSISEDYLNSAYAQRFSIRQLRTLLNTEPDKRFADRGLKSLRASLWRLGPLE